MTKGNATVSTKLELVVSCVLIGCAVVITANVITGQCAADYERGIQELTDGELASALSGGHLIGDGGSPVQIVEFADVECPFCGQYVAVLDSLIEHFDGAVSLRYRHFPITTQHPHAMAGAVAMECAAGQGRFEPFYREVFGKQEEIGTEPWTAFAASAGIADLGAFTRCIDGSQVARVVNADIRAARELGVSATPFVIIGSKALIGIRPLGELIRYTELYQRELRR